MKLHLAAALLGLLVTANASATTLSGQLTVDNEFRLYISDSNDILGTTIVSGND